MTWKKPTILYQFRRGPSRVRHGQATIDGRALLFLEVEHFMELDEDESTYFEATQQRGAGEYLD